MAAHSATPPESVSAQLGRILSSQSFAKAPILSRLLRHLVESQLQGRPDRLKEYSLGVDVFGRGESFDPRIDTIVRVQARRLRSKLGDYYGSEGRADPIVIEVPKGCYLAAWRASDNGARSNGEPAFRQSALPSQLPLPRTPLVGREKELVAVQQLLRSENARLTSLTGAGGSGKTRLALAVAAEMAGEFSGGVYFVSLASIADPGMVAPAIAKVMGVRQTEGKPVVQALQEHLRLSPPALGLLVVDNFEHLLVAAPVLAEILEGTDALKVLVTSRAVLHLYGEHEYPVLPFPVAGLKQALSVDELARNPAVTLFAQRAAAVDPGFQLNRDNAWTVADICTRLDGLPLAIELAAARAKMLTPPAILARLASSLDLLTSGPLDVPIRQQTLRRTIDWSHSLLTAAEQTLFRRLSVFSGGCTIESATAVCNAQCDLEVDPLAGLSSLVNKSLLQPRKSGGESRFVMLETIREYGLERLVAAGEESAVRRAHAAYCLVVAEEGVTNASDASTAVWLTLCDAEHDNFRAALGWVLKTNYGEWALRFGLALFGFWERREHLVEGSEFLDAILNLPSTASPTLSRAKVLTCATALASIRGDSESSNRIHAAGLAIYSQLGNQEGVATQLTCLGTKKHALGDFAAARSDLEQCVGVCRELGDAASIAAALSNLASTVSAMGDHAQARSLLEEVLEIFRDKQDLSGVGWAFNHLGDVARARKDPLEARHFYLEGIEAFQEAGDQWGMARSLADLADLASRQEDFETAVSCFGTALRLFVDLDHKRGIAIVLEGFACLAIRQGAHERAVKLAGAATGLRHSVGARARPIDQDQVDAILRPAWLKQDPAAAKAIWLEGRNMPIEQAVEYALSGTTRN